MLWGRVHPTRMFKFPPQYLSAVLPFSVLFLLQVFVKLSIFHPELLPLLGGAAEREGSILCASQQSLLPESGS